MSDIYIVIEDADPVDLIDVVEKGDPGKSAYQSYLDTTDDDPPMTEEEWAAGGVGVGAPGSDGREIELRTNSTHIQWRYVGDPAWINLVPLADLVGPAGPTGQTGQTGAAGTNGTNGTDGREVQLQNTGTYVQWRYVGGTWTNLIALSAITGPKGETGADSTVPGPVGDTGPAGPNSVTSTTSSDGTAALLVASLTIGDSAAATVGLAAGLAIALG